LLGGQLRRPPGTLAAFQAREAFVIVAMNPVAQRLPIHAARPRRARAIRPFEHQGKGEQAPSNGPVPRSRSLAPKL
jgi:hypothetical protein